MRFAAYAGSEVLDEYHELTELMQRAGKPARVPFEGHLNELGHELYGKVIAAEIMRQNLL